LLGSSVNPRVFHHQHGAREAIGGVLLKTSANAQARRTARECLKQR
jgi:hypothetical protein